MRFELEGIVDMALFARVVDSSSLSEAARQSGIAKSAVSRRITQLERRLGVQLLRRTTRKLHLTREGELFYEHCAQILTSALNAEAAVAGADTSMEGRIVVSAPITFSRLHLTRAIAHFQLEHPQVEIALDAEDALVDTVSSGYDLIVRIARLGDASFVARRLAVDRLVVVGSPAYLKRAGRPECPDQLAQHNCMHYDLVPRNAEWRFREGSSTALAAPQGNFSATNGSLLVEAALAGLGLAVVPCFMVTREVADGRLELVLDGRRKAEVGIFAVTQSARGLPLRLRALLAHLRRWFSDPDWRRYATTCGTRAHTA